MRLRNKWARGIIMSGQALRTPLWDRGLTGAGQIVGMADTGNPPHMTCMYPPPHMIVGMADTGNPALVNSTQPQFYGMADTSNPVCWC